MTDGKVATVADVYAGPDSAYFGERPDWIVLGVKTRDAEYIEEANFIAAARMAEERGIRTDEEGFGHWLFGHGAYLIAEPTDAARDLAREIVEALDAYPILDDEIASDLEHEQIMAAIESELRYRYPNLDDQARADIASFVFAGDDSGTVRDCGGVLYLDKSSRLGHREALAYALVEYRRTRTA